MNLTKSIKKKLSASMVLLALCVLVLLSNYLDRIHTENVKNSISTMYEDRLIVEGYILKMTKNIYQIRELLMTDKQPRQNIDSIKNLNNEFKNTYTFYSKTKLTEIEQKTAEQLVIHFKEFEHAILTNNEIPLIYTEKIIDGLDKLSEIQLDESKLIMKQVESQYAIIKISSQFAFGIVIIILIVLQIMLFSEKKIIPLFKPKDPSLN